MSEPAYTLVYNANKEFLFGLFNRWGAHMLDMAALKMELFRDLHECVDDSDHMEAIRALQKKGWSLGVYEDNDDGWYRSEGDRELLYSMFDQNEHHTCSIFTVEPEKMKDMKILEYAVFQTFTLGEEFKTVDLIWPEECPEEYDEEELDEALDMPRVLTETLTLENFKDAFNALSPATDWYVHEGEYYYMG